MREAEADEKDFDASGARGDPPRGGGLVQDAQVRGLRIMCPDWAWTDQTENVPRVD
ncbi:hypothetical protein GCM10025784_17250 [Citricoccus nitrophenolicus]